LLDRSGEPHAVDLTALQRLRRAGVVVTIVTGRLFDGTRQSAKAIGIDGPVGCADGSHIVDAATGETLIHHGIQELHAGILAQALKARRMAAFAFKENRIIYDAAGEDFLQYVRLWSNDIERTRAVWDHSALREGELTALVALGTESLITDFVEELERAGVGLQIATFAIQRLGTLWGCIVRARVASKGTALAWLAGHHGLTLEETVCVGDWLNDVPMLKVAGRSFAMGQAPAEVKAHATDILPDDGHAGGGGIARIARELFGVE
jgi:hypothetical protein